MQSVDYATELGRFADLDASIEETTRDGRRSFRFLQNGERVAVAVDPATGEIVEERGCVPTPTRHSTYGGLLMSARFGDLKALVAAQRALQKVGGEDDVRMLPIVGNFSDPSAESARTDGSTSDHDSTLLRRLDARLSNPDASGQAVRALVVDGPAGIGKTWLIRQLSRTRAESFGPGSAAPILHVQSRGRVLTSLQDTMAGTLQSLRVRLTFEQVPILVRHGLLQIAIDGFDEMADPNGYDFAWSALNQFLADVSGRATVILAGRDTFIDADMVQKRLPSLGGGSVAAARLRNAAADEARRWLAQEGWTPEEIKALDDSGLFDDGSYALRPFFLATLAKLRRGTVAPPELLEAPLPALIDAILSREVELLREQDVARRPSKRGFERSSRKSRGTWRTKRVSRSTKPPST